MSPKELKQLQQLLAAVAVIGIFANKSTTNVNMN
jgi:hypothetical protein